MECYKLGKGEVKRLKTCEGNAIKSALGLPSILRTTEIFSALSIMGTESTLVKHKIGLLHRLSQNDMTSNVIKFVQETSLMCKDSIVMELDKMCTVNGINGNNLLSKTGTLLQRITNEFEALKVNTQHIGKLLNNSDKAELINTLLPFEGNNLELEISNGSGTDSELCFDSEDNL